MPHLRLLPVLLIAPALSACGYIGAIDFPSFGRGKNVETMAAADPASINSAVDVAALPPPETGTSGTAPPIRRPTAASTTRSPTPSPIRPAQRIPKRRRRRQAMRLQAWMRAGRHRHRFDRWRRGRTGHIELLGGWTMTSGQESCQLFITLTRWTGGYRATTLGCNTGELKPISAWNLEAGKSCWPA